MLNLSPEKVLLLLLIALVVLGPDRLPEAARSMGRLMANLRKMSGSFQTEVRDALAEPSDALKGAVGDLGLDSLRDSLRDVGQVTNAIRNPLSAATRSITDAMTVTPPGAAPDASATAASAAATSATATSAAATSATAIAPAAAGSAPGLPATEVAAPPDDPSFN